MKRSIFVGALLIMILGAASATWAGARSAVWERQALSEISLRTKSRDTTAPNTSITKGPASSTAANTASFYFTASESKATFSCKLDGHRWGRCASPKSYASLALGTHQFAVRATDAAGNTDSTPATYAWTVTAPAPAPDPAPAPSPAPEPTPTPEPEPTPPADTTPPETTIASGPGSSTTATTASFAFASSEPGSSFACRLDSGAWTSCASPAAYSSLALGSHEFAVRATDAAGNADATPATRSWTVTSPTPPADTTPPETTISSGPGSSTTATTASFSFTSNESGSSFACRLDSGAWTSCASPAAYSSLALGSHEFAVRATDAAGNTDATPATRSWTVTSPTPPTETGSCDQTVSSVSAAQSALGSAPLDSVVCLADGSYGGLSLSTRRAAPGVTLRAQHPGAATLGSVSISGAGVAVERFVTGSLNVSASADRVAFRHNSLTGGVYVIGNTSSYAKNVELSGNVIRPKSGSGEKDTLMVQRFEGLRIEDNEIWVADEDGGHNDGLQTVWGGHGLIFRGNWIRGGAGSQGFFIKDGEVTNVTFEDNLVAGRPSKAPYAGSPLQFFDTVPNSARPVLHRLRNGDPPQHDLVEPEHRLRPGMPEQEDPGRIQRHGRVLGAGRQLLHPQRADPGLQRGHRWDDRQTRHSRHCGDSDLRRQLQPGLAARLRVRRRLQRRARGDYVAACGSVLRALSRGRSRRRKSSTWVGATNGSRPR